MFGNRKRRAASNPPLNGPNVNSNAAVAAAQAFLSSRASNASLSSAAAAAALRSRPTTPVSVADVQTKRTIRRAASVNSTASAGSGRPPLERRGSSGSMSERTFRDPSPSRSSQPVPSAPDAPPVPALPNKIPDKSHRRAASMETSPTRMASPPPNSSHGRGSSLGPARMAPQHGRAGQRDSSLSSLQERSGTPSHRGSVNFSLPTNSRPGSPIFTHRRLTSAPQRAQSPMITSPTNTSLVYDPNTRSFLPQVEVLAIEQRMYDAANAPVKKKKRVAPKQATGTHLADKTMGGRPRGTAVDAMEAATVHKSEPITSIESQPDRIVKLEVALERSAEAAPRRRKKKEVVSDSESDQASYIPNSSDGDSDYTIHAPIADSRDGLQLAKKPSIVREDREREEEEDDTPKKTQHAVPRLDTSTTSYRTISPPTLPRSTVGRGKGKGHTSPELSQGPQDTILAGGLNLAPQDQLLQTNGTGKGSIRGGRVNSVSPARSTHFANSPSENLLIKHQPPPRSISPRKSALKHAGAARGSSPLAFETNHGSMSNDTPEELAVPRKKANRVSFDETNVIVGPAAPSVTTDSPVVQSPQTRRSWFSISRGKKKEAPSFDDDEEIMKPRPALPSFGSVREKKPQRDSTPERPLIKPTITADHDTTVPSPPLTTPPSAEVTENPLGQSNDFLAGSILAQDAAMKNTANISKSREPLPPQVTSVEGNGYLSDTNSSIASQDECQDPEISTGSENGIGNVDLHLGTSQASADDFTGNEDIDETKINGGVPDISITGATPTIEATEKMERWPGMPGGWGDEHSDSEQEDNTTDVEDLTPAAAGVAELTPEVAAPLISPVIAGSFPRQNDAIIEESEESEGDSIYSDAAEDISDLDGDGFLSLDAVVESPIVSNSGAETALTTPPDSPASKATKERAYRQSQPGGKTDEQGWEKAQQYWKGLSSDKKNQLELEAEADSTPSPAPKSKKKKTPIKAPLPEMTTAPHQPAPSNQRTYMIAPGTKHDQQPIPLRSSLRAAPQNTPTETHIRKSMRSQGASRSSFRESEHTEQRGILQKKHRPISHGADEYKPDPEAVNAMMKKLTASKTAETRRVSVPPAPSMRRRGSVDSDSSFKRSNKASAEIPRFRSSMRGSVDGGEGRGGSPVASGRFSLRSMSPGSTKRRPFSSGGVPPMPSLPQPTMRSSMRGSGGAAPTMLGSKERAKSPLRLPGFGRSSTKPKQNQAKRSGSRFDDSSDEEDVRPTFRSRFGDSSDEDDGPLPARSNGNGMQKTMRANAPVRGIPRRPGTEDGDSSDLPDSDDEKPTPKPATATTKTIDPYGATKKEAASNEGGALASGSLRRSGSGRGAMSPVTATGPTTRPGQSRRGSLMSILRRKKADPTSKVRKSEAESPARRDTPLERSRSDLATLKALERPTSPKLQKRNPFERAGSGTVVQRVSSGTVGAHNWPLPEPPKIVDGGKRPGTADTVGAEGGAGGEGDERPGLGTRRHTATGLGGVDILGVLPQGRKKKKFGKLRRMFRLDE